MRVTRIMWMSMEESFLVEFANKTQTCLRYGRAFEVYGDYPPMWRKFSRAMDAKGDWYVC
jgi:hypothetical protein